MYIAIDMIYCTSHLKHIRLKIFWFDGQLPRAPEKAGPKNYLQIWCCIIKYYKLSSLVLISYCHSDYLSLAKNGNDFHLLVFKI